MWSNGFSFALRIKRHWCLPVFIIVVTFLALVAVWLSSLPSVQALPLAAIACWQGWGALRAGRPVAEITVDAAGRIRDWGARRR